MYLSWTVRTLGRDYHQQLEHYAPRTRTRLVKVSGERSFLVDLGWELDENQLAAMSQKIGMGDDSRINVRNTYLTRIVSYQRFIDVVGQVEMKDHRESAELHTDSSQRRSNMAC